MRGARRGQQDPLPLRAAQLAAHQWASMSCPREWALDDVITDTPGLPAAPAEAPAGPGDPAAVAAQAVVALTGAGVKSG